MIGSRAWRALMQRNFLYIKRNLISSIFELILPFCFVWILVAVKTTPTLEKDTTNPEIPEFIPHDGVALIPFSYNDYVIALQAERVCVLRDDGDLEISGLPEKSNNWQVPFVKCDSRQCQYPGQDAQPFCEYSMLAIAAAHQHDIGGQERTERFRQWVIAKWPVLQRHKSANQTTGLPFEFDFVQRFPDTTAMDEYVESLDYGTANSPKISMGIVFEGNSTMAYKYTVRQNSTNLNSPEQIVESKPMAVTTPPTNRLFNSYANSDQETCIRERGSPRMGDFQHSCTGRYIYNGVIATQRLVGDFILNETGAADAGYYVSEGGVQFVQFPQKAFIPSGFFATIKDMAPLLVALGLLYPVAAMISYIVREKEFRQKELMKMMSVEESDIEWSWFCTFALFHLISASCAAVASSILYERSSLCLLWIFWVLTFLAAIVFSMACATLSSKSSRAVVIGLLCFFSGVFLTIAVDFQTGNPTVISFVSLHPVAAFAYGIRVLGYLEDLGLGLNYDTISYNENISGLTMIDVCGYLALDVVLWSIISWYFNRVIAPDYGQALPFWFPFNLSSYTNRSTESPFDCESKFSSAVKNIPSEPVSVALKRQTELGKSVEIVNLRKDFGKKSAVDGLSLSMYCGQITALLGHNGAGKTTTIGMLTGAISPSSGHAKMAGKDIRTDMSAIRNDIGICLQHDCLFPQLTVREHIQFFSRVKGLYSKVSRDEAEEQIDQALIDVALSEKRHTLSKNLSGGMQRKLSVAIAFCGGSKIVLLDEPTAGQDPYSRRFTWNVIRQYKKDRIIILTTHFMDEADILADRIAIMAEGQLRCVGSSLFLKKTYGVGYQLTIERGQDHGRRSGRKCIGATNTDECEESIGSEEQMSVSSTDRKLKAIVKDAVCDAMLLSDVGAELSFQLPLGSAHTFSQLFNDLDHQVEGKGINSYGLSVTSLNEVFMLVTRGEEPKTISCDTNLSNSETLQDAGERRTNVRRGTIQSIDTMLDTDSSEDSIDSESQHTKEDMLDDSDMFTRHVVALWKKRSSYFRRDKKAWMCTAVVPSLFVMVGFSVFAFTAPARTMPPLTLRLSDYNTELHSSPVSFNSPSNPFTCQPGICSHQQPYNNIRQTDETYVFCGYEAKLGASVDGFSPTNTKCTVPHTAAVISQVSPDRTVPHETNVSTISEGSANLHNFSNTFASTQYGAIWFSHFEDSIMDDGSLYSTSVIGKCNLATSSLNYGSDCMRFGGVGYVVQYNFTALHSALLYESLANEAIVKHATNNPDFTVEMTIAPLPMTETESGIEGGVNAFLIWFLVVISFPFIGGAYGSFVVQEKSSKAKHLQTVAGVQPCAYWISTFLWDTLNYQIPLWIIVVQMFIFDVDILTTSSREVFSGIVALLFFFGPALAGFTYCVSFAFNSASMCNVIMISSGFLLGMGGPLTCTVLMLLARDPSDPNPSLDSIADVITWILRFTPSFCLGKGLFNAINIDLFIALKDDESLSAWTEPILLYEVYCLAIQSVLYVLFAILLDRWSTSPRVMSMWRKVVKLDMYQFLAKPRSASPTTTLPVDEDVANEEHLVLSGKSDSDAIVIKKLTKVYDDGKVAVDNLSLGIAPGECFGLLGINGAGKTTTMGMLTAEFPPSSGDAALGGFSVTHSPQKIRRLIGYCPQFDALYACLTAREHLLLYGAVKGIHKSLLADAVVAKLLEVGLNESDWDRASSGFSGGMKRRLSLACATMGQPKLIFLDECSTGVDPVSRREIWQLVSNMVAGRGLAQQDKPSMILTTHSMEECEALCPRIGIMANGRLQCIGSAQHLKNKFGRGYQLEMTVKVIHREDDDFVDVLQQMYQTGVATRTGGLNLEQCLSVLTGLTGDESICELVCADSSTGYPIWKDATSPVGVLIEDLAAFATGELRMMRLDTFVRDSFPDSVLRERQDMKARYKVGDVGLRISKIFSSIEQRKHDLFVADYSVSQTSLEQVFNMHAAEAESQKAGRMEKQDV